ncbi:hypothetical protein BFG60_2868 [Microcystis aeruginosa NIES-98]|nr:hypothetical protein BFG60_2868 [Microcystis aeruginosa NIES-98]
MGKTPHPTPHTPHPATRKNFSANPKLDRFPVSSALGAISQLQ